MLEHWNIGTLEQFPFNVFFGLNGVAGKLTFVHTNYLLHRFMPELKVRNFAVSKSREIFALCLENFFSLPREFIFESKRGIQDTFKTLRRITNENLKNC